jgi:hypothetical protein
VRGAVTGADRIKDALAKCRIGGVAFKALNRSTAYFLDRFSGLDDTIREVHQSYHFGPTPGQFL